MQHQAAAALLLPLPALLSWMPLGLAPRCRVRMLRLQGSALKRKREERPSMAADAGVICSKRMKTGCCGIATSRRHEGVKGRTGRLRAESGGHGTHGESGEDEREAVCGALQAAHHCCGSINKQQPSNLTHLVGLLKAVLILGVVGMQEHQLSLG